MAGDWDYFLLWIYTGSLNFGGVHWAYSQTVLAKEPGKSGVDPAHDCKHGFLLCHPMSQALQLLIATHCSSSCVSCHWIVHCLESLDNDACVLRILSFMKNKLASGKTVGKGSEIFWGLQCSSVDSCFLKRTKVQQALLTAAQERAETSSKPLTTKKPRFYPFYFLLLSETFSLLPLQNVLFSLSGCFILWVGCELCLQWVLYVQLLLWKTNAANKSLGWNINHRCSVTCRLLDPLQWTPTGKYERFGNSGEKTREGGWERRGQSSEPPLQGVQLFQRPSELTCPHPSQELWPSVGWSWEVLHLSTWDSENPRLRPISSWPLRDLF